MNYNTLAQLIFFTNIVDSPKNHETLEQISQHFAQDEPNSMSIIFQ